MSDSLGAWLRKLEAGVPGGAMKLGLERMKDAIDVLGLRPQAPIVTVGGTNGKGSVCACVESIAKEAGVKVGCFTSPHLLRYNERIRINGEELSDEKIVESFERVERANRPDRRISYFEYNALAAMDAFMRARCELIVLEVGMGGRLDAANAFDADVAVVSTVDIDHAQFLGDTIEKIAFEKAGIFRPNKWAIYGDVSIPRSLENRAQEIGAPLLAYGRDFSAASDGRMQWNYAFNGYDPNDRPDQPEAPRPRVPSLPKRARYAMPLPPMRGDAQIKNAATALTVFECLRARIDPDQSSVKRGVSLAVAKGRFQVLPGRPLTVLDVGHNPQAARNLKSNMGMLPFARRSVAVFSILADKDIDACLNEMKGQFDLWRVAPLAGPRGRDKANLLAAFAKAGIKEVVCHDSIAEAWMAAKSEAKEDDRIVVFGSFHTVAEAMRAGAH